MKNIIFLEGVSGVGKSTTVSMLNEKLQSLGYNVSCHFEGDPDGPLDLCWAAYLTISEYEKIFHSYPEFTKELSENIIFYGEYVLLRYQVAQSHLGRTKLYSPELYEILRKKEFCYNPTNIASLSKFTEVFANLWERFAKGSEVEMDYVIFDASLVSHMTSDMIRNYNASIDETIKHLEVLLETIKQFNPIVFYLSSQNVGERLKDAIKSRGQTPPSDEQIGFWERRKQLDIPILSRLSV